MRAAKRQDLLSLQIRDRRFGWPFEMVLRAHAAGWRMAEVDVPYRARTGEQGHGQRLGDHQGVGGPREGDAASPMVNLLIIAKAPIPGRSKTRLCPPCTPLEAARIAEAALADTIAVVMATPGVRPILALDGEPGSWLPHALEVSLSAATVWMNDSLPRSRMWMARRCWWGWTHHSSLRPRSLMPLSASSLPGSRPFSARRSTAGGGGSVSGHRTLTSSIASR